MNGKRQDENGKHLKWSSVVIAMQWSTGLKEVVNMKYQLR